MKKITSVSSNSTFGAAKPLPGQAGYKVSETTILERDAKEMEARLKMLQERMRLQQQEAEANAKLAGAGSNSRWKSSKTEKGSIRSYGKEVQEKHKKRTEESGGDTSIRSAVMTSSSIDVSASRRKQTEYPSAGSFLSKEIDRWTANDVGDWLASVNLHQYIDAFILNEINGIILLDITLEDLDYMGITALGHRKTILKGAEDLRVHRRVVNPPHPPPAAGAGTEQQSPNRQKYSSLEKSVKEEGESSLLGSHGSPRAPKTEPVKATHWSMLEPLSKMEVHEPGNQSSSINAADSDIYDEEAERRAFQEAVGAWRKGGQTESQKSKAAVPTGNVTIERDYDSKKDDGMWQNPFMSPAPAPALAPSRAKESQPNTSASNPSLKHGNLNEELEHAEFVRAVDAWRTAGKGKPSSASTSSSSSSVGTAGGKGFSTTSHLVEKLAKELEQEQEELSKRLQRQKEEATLKLKQLKQSSFSVSKSSAREEVEEEKGKPSVAKVFDDEVTEDEDENDEGGYYRNKSEEKYGDIHTYTFSKSPSDYHSRYNREDEDNDNEDDGGHTSPHSPQQSSSVAISLVESVMYGSSAAGSAVVGEEESYYIVEYDSDTQGA